MSLANLCELPGGLRDSKGAKSWGRVNRKPRTTGKRDPIGNGGVERVLWEIKVGQGVKPAIEAIVSPRLLDSAQNSTNPDMRRLHRRADRFRLIKNDKTGEPKGNYKKIMEST